MRVLNVYDKVNISEKNNRAYHNCTLTCGVIRNYDGQEVMREVRVRLTSSCVDEVMNRYQLRSMDELKGKNVSCYRQAPIYLSDFEKQFNIIMCDVLVIERQ